ncbi:DNA-packaging protein [Methylocella silvestris]|uniref:ATP-binding protein n=1 Tax=Methylocella silvestris TaxID=199596 RepID=A0A2J7TLJ4_METSI|nr:terminase family protein [Methylocella silvestris]PNG27643.1 ATP-binding protein [Methylocella silvestris]
MSEMFNKIADALENSWLTQARPNQLPPDGDWSIWAIIAGRGFGKTRAAAEFVSAEIESGRARRVGLVGSTASDTRDVMVAGESGLLSIGPEWSRPQYEPSKRLLTYTNGAIAMTFSAEEPNRLRGPAHDLIWADEICAWSNLQETYDMMMMGLRLGKRPRLVISTTPRPLKILKDILSREGQDVAVSRGSTHENRDNLAPSFVNSIIKKYEGTRLGRQELDAELLEDTPGALWNRDLIERARISVDAVPEMTRVVVAIDPAISNNEDSDETGIVVAGLGVDGKGYILRDASGRYAPVEWARIAVALYHEHRADRIVAEVNQGGAMVETTVRAVDPNVSYRPVHASRGKITRAEPVSALFEQNRVHLVGAFPALEDQMSSFAPGVAGSPDRLDAMVWAITDLMIQPQMPNWGLYELARRGELF